MFKPLDPKKNIPVAEKEVLDFWRHAKIFERSVSQRQGNSPFVFYEGPPTANGKPGIHHVITRTFKDVICRYQTMKGRYVLRKAGWDTHGLPVELQVEKALGLKNKQEIEAYGVAQFNQRCRDSVWQYKEEWERLTERMGYWIDLKDPYITYTSDYIESVWWAFRQIWDKGLIYQDYKVVPYCPRCGTGLSLAEVAQGYKDVTETSVYVRFRLADEPDEYILAWTTTPWTLPGNVGLAVGKNILYAKINVGKDIYYLAKDRLSTITEEYTVLEEMSGKQLVGRPYFPLFATTYLGNKDDAKQVYDVLSAEFVTTEEGTGIVHTAVMYGEDDYNLGKSANLPMQHTVDERGRFNELVPQWQGQFVKDAEPAIIEYLTEQKSVYKTAQTTHSYPFCWRCGTPLLYYARNSWFIKIDQVLRNRLVALNREVTWVPEHVKDGRFGNWLEGLRDWAISRERYWGTPMPIWICQQDSTHQRTFGSLAELREAAINSSKTKLTVDFDPHKPYIDEIEVTCLECQGIMKRVPEVLDVWFDSGAMPFAQWGYPANPVSEQIFTQQFPADYISEAIDQTRGWFNTLLILSTLLFDKAAYRSVICLNHVLDEKGQKMSKSKGNVVDPWKVIETTGIDPLRMFFLTVNQPGEYKNFSLKAVQDVSRKTVMIWLNVVNFFLTYAAIDDWQPGQSGELNKLDEWILSLSAQTTGQVERSLDELDTFTAARTVADFIDQLSTWYLRRSRKRRDHAFYQTLHAVLIQLSQIAAPMMPFVAETTYRALRTGDMAESVHLTDWPVANVADSALLSEMATVRQLVTLGHAARAEAGLKVRQPLAEAKIAGLEQTLSADLLVLLADELNVKHVAQSDQIVADWPAATIGQLTIGLDPVISSELKREGLFRDLTREFQELRKNVGCQPGQLVSFFYQTESPSVAEIFQMSHVELLMEVSGHSLTERGESPETDAAIETNVDGARLWLGLAINTDE